LPATAIAIFLPDDKNDMLQLTKMTGRSMTIWLHVAFWLVLGVLNLVLSNWYLRPQFEHLAAISKPCGAGAAILRQRLAGQPVPRKEKVCGLCCLGKPDNMDHRARPLLYK
jgi:hypothetical protein